MALVMTKPSDSPLFEPNKFHDHRKTRTDGGDVNALPCGPTDKPVEVPLSFRDMTRGYDSIMIAVPLAHMVSSLGYSGCIQRVNIHSPGHTTVSNTQPRRAGSWSFLQSHILRE